MKTFLTKVSVFNGKFWRDGDDTRIEASSMGTAAARAARGIRKEYPGKRFEKIKIEVTKLKGI